MFNAFVLTRAASDPLHGLDAPRATHSGDVHTATAKLRTLAPGARHAKPRFGLTAGRAGGSGPCGVWRCTWPVSGGGCLVWEKTVCKVINPFD